jgi:hypothetical protein
MAETSNKQVASLNTFPVQPLNQPEQDMLVSGLSNNCHTLVDQTYETVTTNDATVRHISLIKILADRSSSISLRVNAYDKLNSRVAAVAAEIFVVRYGNGPILMDCNLVEGKFDPNTAPWNLIKAKADVCNTDFICVELTGLAGVKIRWSVWCGIFGAQGR